MRAVLLSVSTLLLLATGCVSSGYPECDSVCESYNACGWDVRFTDIMCPDYCGEVLNVGKRAAAAGQSSCKAEFDAHLSCWNSNKAQICDAEFTDCQDEADTWTECINAYCASEAGATDTVCADGEIIMFGI